MSAPLPEGNEDLAKLLLTESLKQLVKRVQSGEATAADLNVALQTVKAMGIEMIPRKGNAADQLRKAVTANLPFAGSSEDRAH